MFRMRSYSLIVFNVPLGINPEDKGHIQEICEVNSLETGTIMTAKWAKPADKRSPEQRTAHLLITLNGADTSNRSITNGLNICNRRCHIEKVKCEPIRCLKCQGWNHFTRDFPETADKCGNCMDAHRTNTCPSPHTRKCASCNSSEHESWCRTCLVYLKKVDDFNSRNPENSLQFFPTADPWTWTSTDRPNIQMKPPPPKPVELYRTTHVPQQTQGQQNNRTHQVRRVGDHYIPSYSDHHGDHYVLAYGDRQRTRPRTPGWNEPLGFNDWHEPIPRTQRANTPEVNPNSIPIPNPIPIPAPINNNITPNHNTQNAAA